MHKSSLLLGHRGPAIQTLGVRLRFRLKAYDYNLDPKPYVLVGTPLRCNACSLWEFWCTFYSSALIEMCYNYGE